MMIVGTSNMYDLFHAMEYDFTILVECIGEGYWMGPEDGIGGRFA
jgi:hypothetical protein